MNKCKSKLQNKDKEIIQLNGRIQRLELDKNNLRRENNRLKEAENQIKKELVQIQTSLLDNEEFHLRIKSIQKENMTMKTEIKKLLLEEDNISVRKNSNHNSFMRESSLYESMSKRKSNRKSRNNYHNVLPVDSKLY